MLVATVLQYDILVVRERSPINDSRAVGVDPRLLATSPLLSTTSKHTIASRRRQRRLRKQSPSQVGSS